MPGFNLVRNSKVFFTDAVDANTGVVNTAGLLNTNTQEVSVLNGFSFSQAVDAQTITVSEAGDTPARGQRSFNSALQPVEFSFSTYLRPRGANATIGADEAVLWNALLSPGKFNPAPSGITVPGEFSAAYTTAPTRTASSAEITIAWASLNLTVPNINVGDKVNVSGIINSGTTGWNGGATVKTITGTLAACTGMVLTMDVPPPGTGAASGASGTVFISKNSAGLRAVSAGTEPAYLQFTPSLANKNQLQKFGMVIVIDQSTYVIDNCVLDQASIDFNLEGIATVSWSGKGTVLRTLAATSANAGSFSGAISSGTYAQAAASGVGGFITNKISTATLKSTFLGAGTGNKNYAIALTGGNLTIANNVTYITPENLGVVNKPIGYFTGTRSISGSLTAYLKVGAGNTTSTLLTDLLAAPSEVKYYLEVQVGGINAGYKVELEMPAVTVQVPTVDVQDVVSTSINFTAQGSILPSGAAADLADTSTTSFYDVEAANELMVRYYSAA